MLLLSTETGASKVVSSSTVKRAVWSDRGSLSVKNDGNERDGEDGGAGRVREVAGRSQSLAVGRELSLPRGARRFAADIQVERRGHLWRKRSPRPPRTHDPQKRS